MSRIHHVFSLHIAQEVCVNILINSLMKQGVFVDQILALFAVWHLCTVSALR